MATTITVRDNGSLRIEGDFELKDGSGKAYGLAGRTRIGLCRCGLSADKPFCDGAHRAANFEHKAEARDLPAPE